VTEAEECIDVRDLPESGRFEIWVDGVRAGLTSYADMGAERTFPHTEIDAVYGGRGLAKRVVREALDATRSAGLYVIPRCSMVSDFIRKNPDYADLVPSNRHAEFGL